MEFLAELHPKIVHFPIALFFTYSLFEAAGVLLKKEYLNKAALILLAIGIASGVLALITGNQAYAIADLWEQQGATIPFKAMQEHQDYATITMFYFTFLLVIRIYLALKKKFEGKIRYLIIILAFIGCYFVFLTGDYGGKLVYKHGVGTELIKPE